ncbi:hypothetical protein BWQ96_06211 [Gracilariopsis chorda]|uniref:Uncharacterized protein n=1 Tax=Gracilariopsis chorda TaxID=448386 RepID=A0A2V3IPN3_9FLOR|nr:hypothetical protein BWQ96_06211 [Gracilariopsis chorda]|eukprot:PXF44038.1 hypothetical protein BWQ96_06211 [Gracilariopsis chorda]
MQMNHTHHASDLRDARYAAVATVSKTNKSNAPTSRSPEVQDPNRTRAPQTMAALTLNIPSGLINAGVYVLFDVLVVATFVSLLASFQAWRVSRTLFSDNTVTVRDSRFSFLAPGIRSLNSHAHLPLIACHVIFLCIIFALNLGINGRTRQTTRPISRSFLSKLSASEFEFGIDRLSFRLFASCTTPNFNSSMTYFPVAFNAVPNRSVSDPTGFRDSQGKLVPLDVNSFQCQSFGNLPPILHVPRCGATPQQCTNVVTAPIHTLIANTMTPNSTNKITASKPWHRPTIFLSGNPPPTVRFHLPARVHSPSYHPNSTMLTFNRLICRETPYNPLPDPQRRNSFWLNCIFGKWDSNDTLFTFRVGHAVAPKLSTLPNSPTWDQLQSQNSYLFVNFSATTAVSTVQWPAHKYGESAFAEALFAIRNDLMPAKAFLDELVTRASAPSATGSNIALLEPVPENVTDIHLGAFVSYVIVLFAVFIPYLALHVHRNVLGTPRFRNILGYNGLGSVFMHATRLSEYGVEEGAGDAQDSNGLSFALSDLRDCYHGDESTEGSC